MALVEIPDALLAELAPFAAADFLTVDIQVVLMVRDQLTALLARDRQRDMSRDRRVTDAERQRRKRNRDRGVERDEDRDMSRDGHVTAPLPPSPPLSPLPSPTTPSNPTLAPTPTHPPLAHAHARDGLEMPFACDEPKATEHEMSTDPALEEISGGISTPRRAQPAPKPERSDATERLKRRVADDARFLQFRAAWPKKSERRNDRIPDLMRYWEGYRVGESPRFEHTMAALEDKKRSNDWTRTDKDGVPAPAAWINTEPWVAREMAETTDAAPPNPYEHKPWGPIYAQAGMPTNYVGWLNLVAEIPGNKVDPREVGRVFVAEGAEAAGDALWHKLHAV